MVDHAEVVRMLRPLAESRAATDTERRLLVIVLDDWIRLVRLEAATKIRSATSENQNRVGT